MKDLYLLTYNNYYNRIIKKFDELIPYQSYLCADIARRVNFIPNDGISTQVIINANKFNIYNTPDYLLVTENGEIDSRWFVIKAARTSCGQYQLDLRRDVIADNLDAVLDAECIIKKGTVLQNDPAIFNTEGFKFNQIKQSETLLKDYTGVPWIVAYISPDVSKDHGDVTGDIEGYYDETYASLDEYPLKDYIGKDLVNPQDAFFVLPVTTNTSDASGTNYLIYQLNSPNVSYEKENIYGITHSGYLPNLTSGSLANAARNANVEWKDELSTREARNQLARSLVSSVSGNYIYLDSALIDQNNIINQLQRASNKIIKIGDKYYRANYTPIQEDKSLGSYRSAGKINVTINTTLVNFESTLPSSYVTYEGQKIQIGDIKCYVSNYARFTLTEIGLPVNTFKYGFSNVNLTNPETPYGIICAPYSDNVKVIAKGKQEAGNIDKETRIKMFQALAQINGLLYDIQLLPYCPILSLNVDENEGGSINLELPSTTSIQAVDITNSENQYVTSFFVSPTANISFNLYKYTISLTDLKRQNETDLWRLCSPNYAGVFEFNAAKFYTGSLTVINYFHVDCTFKPYTPYIHVSPEFKGLYGRDFADSRGLICSGDFSLDRISDAWETYQYNNKNFQLQFDRQVDTMEFEKGWNTASAAVNGIGNTIAGVLGGAVGGYMAGNTTGGIVGGIVGGVAGLADTIYNTIETTARSDRAIEDAKLQFNYSNENIQAQPYALTKVTALNESNKLFPFIEYYTCTDKEKEVFDNYIKYTGMSVNRIDKIRNYIYDGEENYVKAQLLRINVDNNAQIASFINQELEQGVYFYAN